MGNKNDEWDGVVYKGIHTNKLKSLWCSTLDSRSLRGHMLEVYQIMEVVEKAKAELSFTKSHTTKASRHSGAQL